MAELSEHRRILREYMTEHFSLSELKTLCFDLGIDHEMIYDGPDKSSLVRSLIIYCERNGKLINLIGSIYFTIGGGKVSLDDRGLAIYRARHLVNEYLMNLGVNQNNAAEAYFNTGLRNHIISDFGEAKRNYEICLEINPHYPRAKEKLREVEKLIDRNVYRRGPMYVKWSRTLAYLLAAIILWLIFEFGANRPVSPTTIPPVIPVSTTPTSGYPLPDTYPNPR